MLFPQKSLSRHYLKALKAGLLIALSTANQANAQCVGSPTLTCTGTTTSSVLISSTSPISDLIVQAGADITVGGTTNSTIAINNTANINNMGTIDATENARQTLLLENSTGGAIINSGVISYNGEYIFADAIVVGGGGTYNIINSGTIENTATVNNSNRAIQAIRASSSGAVLNVTNSGVISTARAGAAAIYGDSNGGRTSTLDNQVGGVITTASSATSVIEFFDGADTITNAGTIVGVISTGGGGDVLTNTGSITGNVNQGSGDDVFNLNLDTGFYIGTADGDSHTVGDIVNADASAGNEILELGFVNYETLNLSGDNEIATTGTATFENVNLLGTTDLAINNGSVLTATTGLIGASGNDVTVNASGRLNADTTLTGGDETFTIEGDVNGDIDLGAGDDTLIIYLDTGSYVGTADGGTHAIGDTLVIDSDSSDATINADSVNFEDLDLSGDNQITLAGDHSVETTTLLGTTDLSIANGGSLTATSGVYGTAGNNVNVDAGGAITASITLTAADETVTNNVGGVIIGDIMTGAGVDVVTLNGDMTGDIDLGGDDDILNIDLDTAAHNGNADGGAHTAGDVLNVDSANGDATLDGNYINFETANLTGDQTISTTGTSTFDTVTLAGETNLEVSNGSILTATTGLMGTTANYVTIASGGTLNADTTLTAGADNFTNAGTFNGNLDLGLGGDIFTNSGLATGDITSADGANTFNLNAGSLIGDLNLSMGTDTLNFNGTNITGNVLDADVVTGTSSLFLNADTTVTGDVTVNNIRLNSGNTLTTNALNTDNLIFDVATNTSYGALNITGGPVDLTGINVSALITDAVNDGDEIAVATGTGQITGLSGDAGQAFTNIDDTSLLFDFGIADGSQAEVTSSVDNTTLYILSDKVFQIREVIRKGNKVNVGEVLEVLEVIPPGINSPEIQAVLSKVNSAGSAEELSNILQAAVPAVDGGSFSAAQNVTGNTLRLVSDRLTVIRDRGGSASGVSSGDITENVQMWGQVFGHKIDQGERDAIAGFDAITRGVTVGVDTEAVDDATIGVAFSYADTDVKSDSVNTSRSDINSYNVSLYGDYDLNDTTYLVGDIGYTYGDNESTRFNVGGVAGLNADSDYVSHQVEARIIAARDYNITEYDGVRATPKVQAHYIHFQAEDVTETGAGGAGLEVESEALNILELGVGVDVRKDYIKKYGSILSPEISVGYRYDVIGDALQTTSTFNAGGPSFESEGADPNQGTLNLGVGVGYTTPTNVEFTASYDYESKDEFNSHSAFLRLAAPF